MDATTEPRVAGRRRVLGALAVVAGLAVVSFNLRPAIVAVGPLTARIQGDTGLGSAATGLLTTLPVVCLGVFAATAAPLARRVGLERGVLVALLLLALGCGLRLADPVAALFAGSALAGCGIAVANVLVPTVVKQDFPHRTGSMMATYSIALQLGATLASGLTVPLADGLGLGWRAALALWGLPVLGAVAAWLPRALPAYAVDPARVVTYRVWRSRLGWAAAGFMGLQSAMFYSLTAWLPSLLQDAGLSEGRAGLMLSLVALTGIASGLPMPLLAVRMGDQRPLVAAVVLTFALGLLVLLLDPAGLALPAALLLGLGQGAGLSLALTLFTLRGRAPATVAQLSGMAQTGGYVIAAAGPFAVGLLHSAAGGWGPPVVLLCVLLVPLGLTGSALARPRFVEDEVAAAG